MLWAELPLCLGCVVVSPLTCVSPLINRLSLCCQGQILAQQVSKYPVVDCPVIN